MKNTEKKWVIFCSFIMTFIFLEMQLKEQILIEEIILLCSKAPNLSSIFNTSLKNNKKQFKKIIIPMVSILFIGIIFMLTIGIIPMGLP